MTLSARIKAIRLRLGYDQSQFAKIIGTSQSTVDRWERGSAPRLDALKRIAALASTSMEALAINPPDRLVLDGQIPICGRLEGARLVARHDILAFSDGAPDGGGRKNESGRVAFEVGDDSLMPVVCAGSLLVCEVNDLKYNCFNSKKISLLKIKNEGFTFGRLI